jgi:hypothetical protein
MLHFGKQVEGILQALPSAGLLFPYAVPKCFIYLKIHGETNRKKTLPAEGSIGITN